MGMKSALGVTLYGRARLYGGGSTRQEPLLYRGWQADARTQARRFAARHGGGLVGPSNDCVPVSR